MERCYGPTHDYKALPGDRYAKDGEFSCTCTRIWYHMIFCSKCGDTVEVVAEDRRMTLKGEGDKK